MSRANAPASAQAVHPLFEACPELHAHAAASMRRQSFGHNDSVLSHGDPATSLWLVESGWVKLSRQTPDGKETIVGLCTAGDLFGEAALFPHANYPYTVEVVGAGAVLAAIPAAVMRSWVASNPSLAAAVMAWLNAHSAQTRLQLEHMNTLSAAQRLGCFLLRLCHTQCHGGKTLQIPVEKNVLAAYLGMKPETLSRSQQQLKPVGVEVHGHDITIYDVGKLQEFVCGSCSESGNCDVECTAG